MESEALLMVAEFLATPLTIGRALLGLALLFIGSRMFNK